MKAAVKFPAYRTYEKSRIEMNDAIMISLVSLQITKHTLKTISDNELMLPEIFPTVDRIQRVNLSVNSANRLLIDADPHLATMAIPYILALHEDYVMTCLSFLNRAGLISSQTIRSTSPKKMHENFMTATNSNLPTKLLEQFHLLRLIRNSTIHAGGVPDTELKQYLLTIGRSSIVDWEKITGKHPSQLIIPNKVTKLGYGEALVALMITTNIAKELNIHLQSALPQVLWRDILQEDFMNNHAKIDNLQLRTRKISTYAKQYYRAISLSKSDLDQIARQTH